MADEERQPPATMVTVVDCATACLESFQQCLDKSASIHPRELSLVEDQLARFTVWTANIGVFARGRGSLDHRLRDAPDVRDVVVGLLEALGYRTQNCLTALESLDQRAFDGSLPPIDEGLDLALRNIADEIGLLHRFSNTIQRASKDTQNWKAARDFQICDDEGNNAESFLTELFSNYIRDRFPNVSDSTRQRLASSMLLRRRRILYRKSRYANTLAPQQKLLSQPTVIRPTARTPPQPSGEHQVVDLSQKTDAKVVHGETAAARSVVHSAVPSAITLKIDNYKKASTMSVVSVSKTVALSSHEELPFPPPPDGGFKRRYGRLKKKRDQDLDKLVSSLAAPEQEEIERLTKEHDKGLEEDRKMCLEAIGEITCPFCFNSLPAEEVIDENKWRLHVTSELDPYVCLFEPCSSEEELYGHSHQWIKHMREHKLQWRCTAKSHSKIIFETKEDYVDHMKAAHPGKLNDAQLGVLANMNARMSGSLFNDSCPFICGAEITGSMEDHVVGHMRLIALRSLPSYEEDTGDLGDSASQESASTGVTGATARSTIAHDKFEWRFESSRRSRPFKLIPETVPSVRFRDSHHWPDEQGFRNYMTEYHKRVAVSTTDPSAPRDALWTSDGRFHHVLDYQHALRYENTLPHEHDLVEYQGLEALMCGEMPVINHTYEPTAEFVDRSAWDENVKQDIQRSSEWGFIPSIFRTSEDPNHDPIIHSLAEREKRREEAREREKREREERLEERRKAKREREEREKQHKEDRERLARRFEPRSDDIASLSGRSRHNSHVEALGLSDSRVAPSVEMVYRSCPMASVDQRRRESYVEPFGGVESSSRLSKEEMARWEMAREERRKARRELEKRLKEDKERLERRSDPDVDDDNISNRSLGRNQGESHVEPFGLGASRPLSVVETVYRSRSKRESTSYAGQRRPQVYATTTLNESPSTKKDEEYGYENEVYDDEGGDGHYMAYPLPHNHRTPTDPEHDSPVYGDDGADDRYRTHPLPKKRRKPTHQKNEDDDDVYNTDDDDDKDHYRAYPLPREGRD